MSADRSKLEHAHRLLAAAVDDLVTGERWRAMVAAAARFPRYSARNVLLLESQGAHGHVAGYRAWQRIPAHGGGACQVRRGATGLVILAPCHRTIQRPAPDTGEPVPTRTLAGFRVATVFDEHSLTRPPALPDVAPKALTTHTPGHVRDALIAVIEADGHPVTWRDTTPANGITTYHPPNVIIHHQLPGLPPVSWRAADS